MKTTNCCCVGDEGYPGAELLLYPGVPGVEGGDGEPPHLESKVLQRYSFKSTNTYAGNRHVNILVLTDNSSRINFKFGTPFFAFSSIFKGKNKTPRSIFCFLHFKGNNKFIIHNKP